MIESTKKDIKWTAIATFVFLLLILLTIKLNLTIGLVYLIILIISFIGISSYIILSNKKVKK